jgi:hypothetical protein
MKPSRQVTLALVGWLLLTPPYARNGRFDSKAPLIDWMDAAEFISHAECEDYRRHVKPEDLARNGQKGVINELAEAKLRMQGQCVSSDDPRLQKN